ncbi:DUF5994 family protein [Actinomadura rupiterrae]|uniref:DUF5994 family protein n=1 Tax=Actinomadura rupiterrae TaxID=559627 RepID=UPI0020A5A7CC|nr:DUF5994 family protein [Actinomadura rupiterrae]MCP2343136.1 hypothetical protein [Actinomadura rupiterrae]
MWTTAERATTISLSPPSTPRLHLRPPLPPGAPGTPLDGGWWPRSADPVAELPGLVLALQAHGPADDHRPIAHIMLCGADWDSRPRRLRIDADRDGPADTRVVRLSWFDSLPTGLLTAIWADGRRMDLLTVPAATARAAARAALELAAHPANHLRAPELRAALTASTGPQCPAAPEEPLQSTSEGTWESEGGRLREHLEAR